ncbi:MAG: IS66 family transposase [Oscillospiraceae bacterium]|nr:IS66 family transposase [Oscillospiraceae bacterium]
MDTTIIVLELQQQVALLAARVNELLAQNAKQEILIKHYENQILLLKRQKFGQSSEKYSTGDCHQLNFLGEPENTPIPEPETEDITYSRKKRKGKREEDLSGLPVERIDHELPENGRGCPECGESMKDIGVDIRRELKLIPAQVIVVEHATHAYACDNPVCEENTGGVTIVKAESPKPIIPGSLASSSLVAHIAYQKYSNGLPLYRLEKGFQYDGVIISRQTMSNWVMKCAEIYLLAIYLMLKTFLLKESVLHADETTVQVLREPGRDPQSKSYEWVYRTSGCCENKIVIYDYQETRKREHPEEFLKDFKGFLHTDGYEVYHGLPPDIVIVGCWSHARRYWEKILKTIAKDKRKGTDAERGVAYINMLFDLEREFKNLSPEERYKARLEKSKPIADAFFAWADKLSALPKSPLGEARHYALSQQKYLENVFLDGRTELSNNRCERSVKPFVMGRKNWLFSNTPDGAKASSVMYSIIETAKENGLHPFHYLKFLLETLPNTTTGNLEALLPWSVSLPEVCRVTVK